MKKNTLRIIMIVILLGIPILSILLVYPFVGIEKIVKVGVSADFEQEDLNLEFKIEYPDLKSDAEFILSKSDEFFLKVNFQKCEPFTDYSEKKVNSFKSPMIINAYFNYPKHEPSKKESLQEQLERLLENPENLIVY